MRLFSVFRRNGPAGLENLAENYSIWPGLHYSQTLVCQLKPPNRIKFYGRLIVSFQKRWSTIVDHRRSNDLPIIRRIRLWFIVIVTYKNIYSLSDRNIILLMLSPVKLNLLLVKSRPSVLKILSAVVEVATTHKYFLAKFTR